MKDQVFLPVAQHCELSSNGGLGEYSRSVTDPDAASKACGMHSVLCQE